jgi:hypothetical protein
MHSKLCSTAVNQKLNSNKTHIIKTDTVSKYKATGLHEDTEEELSIRGQVRASSALLPPKELPIPPLERRLVGPADSLDEVARSP